MKKILMGKFLKIILNNNKIVNFVVKKEDMLFEILKFYFFDKEVVGLVIS